jgi:hypothetical protein
MSRQIGRFDSSAGEDVDGLCDSAIQFFIVMRQQKSPTAIQLMGF